MRQSNLPSRRASKASAPVAGRGDFHVIVIEQFDDALTLDFVVFDHQQAAPARLGVAHNAIEGFFQFVGRSRFDQIGECAVPQALQALFLDADNLHRNVPRRRVLLQMIQAPSNRACQAEKYRA